MGFRNAVTYVYPGLMANKDMQRIIQTKDVDLVILDGIWNDFTYAMIDHLGVPFVIYSPGPGATWTLESMSVDQEFASVPNLGLDVRTPMGFLDRAVNLVSTKVFMFIRKVSILWYVDAMAVKDFPDARLKRLSVTQLFALLTLIEPHQFLEIYHLHSFRLERCTAAQLSLSRRYLSNICY